MYHDTQWTFGAVVLALILSMLIGAGILALADAVGQIVQHRLSGF